MDVHVPAAITDGLRRRAIDVLTCQEDGNRTALDEAVLQRALDTSRVQFSQDQDLLRISVARQRDQLPFSGLVIRRLRVGALGSRPIEEAPP